MESTRPPPLPDPLEGRVLAGGLRVLQRVGETSEGSIYHAEYSPQGPAVALVALRAQAHPREASSGSVRPTQLLLQLERASRIRHPNVAAIREVGETADGILYAVVEALAGERLSEILITRGTLALWEAANFCLQAAAGLDAAHAAGIVHGALSPHSLLVTHADGRPLIKLIGFALGSPAEPQGLVRPVGGATRSKYAAPERRDGHAPDERGDVFSLGAVLHHMLAGAPPGRGAPRGSMPRNVRAVLARALAAEPAERFQTIAHFAETLEHAVKNPREARAPRSRRMLLLGAGALVLVAVGLRLARRAESAADIVIHGGQESGATAAPVPDTARQAAAEPKPGVGDRRVSRQLKPPAPTSPSPKLPPPVKPSRVATVPSHRAGPIVAGGVPDPAPRVALSPFRQAHPWAARPGGRFYFRSSCRLALRSSDLLYFTSEEEARATGRSKSAEPGCS
jgi:serine/threonine protein kinase